MNITSQLVSNSKFKFMAMSALVHYKNKPMNTKFRLNSLRNKIIKPRSRITFETDNFYHDKESLFYKKGNIQFSMICCPMGKFTKGSKDSFLDAPEGTESIDRMFLLGESEVTQELFQKVMGFNPSQFKKENGYSDSDKRPVEKVTWYEAVMFCNKLSMMFGKKPFYHISVTKGDYHIIKEAIVKINQKANGFRLPLGKEWEYAAKAGTNNEWSGTNDEKELGVFAYFQATSRINNILQTHTVKGKKPNEWGFYDMSGNVMEWCWDAHIDPYYGTERRQFRCGSFVALPRGQKVAMSHIEYPQNYSETIGFRICMNVS